MPGGGAWAAESKALALVEERHQHKAATRAGLSTASFLAGKQTHHEVESPNLFDAARGRIQATCKLLAASLDATLANIEREDIQAAARAMEFAALALAEEATLPQGCNVVGGGR